MDSKDKGLTISQKIVTDAVLRMNDDEKLEWLSRRYKEQGKIDQAFEIILSSISPTKDFSSLFEIINHVKDNKKRFDLIKSIDDKISETSDKFRYNAEGTETYCSALAKSVATFDTPEEVLSFLNLNTLNSEVIGSIINKMITFPLNKELISKISEISETLNIDAEKWDAYYQEEDFLGDHASDYVDVEKITSLFGDAEQFEVIYLLMVPNILPEKVRPCAMRDFRLLQTKSQFENYFEEAMDDLNFDMEYKEIIRDMYHPILKFMLPEAFSEYIYYLRPGNYYEKASYLHDPKLLDSLANANINLNLLFDKITNKEGKRFDLEELVSKFDSRKDAISAMRVYEYITHYAGVDSKKIDIDNAKEDVYQYIYNSISTGITRIDYGKVKIMPEDFKIAHPDLFLSDKAPKELEEAMIEKSGVEMMSKLLEHPEWVDILARESINLNLIYRSRGYREKEQNIELLAKQFDSRKDAINVLNIYNYLYDNYEDEVINFEDKNSKEEIYQKIHGAFLRRRCPYSYIESMPEDFKREHPDLFLGKDAPEELRTLICEKHFNGNSLFNHPEWLDILANQKLDLNLLNNSIFNKNGIKIDSNEFVNKFENKKAGLFVLLNYREMDNYYCKINPDETKPEVMIALAVKYNLYKMHPIFSTTFPFTDLLTDEVLESMLGFKDEQDKQIDVKRVINEFGSREEIAKIWVIYDQMFRNKANGRIDPNNIKESIYQNIHEFIMNGGKYSEDMPEDFKEKYSDLFLSQNAPEELKVKVYGKKYDTWSGGIDKDMYAAIYQNPEWVNVLVEENINLNVLFKLEDENNNYIDPETAINEFDDRRGAINAWALYYNITGAKKIPNSKDKLYPKIYEAILDGTSYPEKMPEGFKKEHPDLFLSNAAPEELRELLCNRELTSEKLLEHPEWVNVLVEENINLNLIFKLRDANNKYIDIETIVNEFDSKEDALTALVVYSNIRNSNIIPHFEDVKEEMCFEIYEGILNGTKYSEDMPEDFKKEHPELFLDKTIPEDIRTKFYQKQFTLKDFEENPNLIRTFGNTNLLFGLKDSQYCFMGTLFKGHDANNDCLKAIEIFNESTNEEEADFIRESIIESHETIGTIRIEKFPDLIELHKNVQYSNAVELSSFKRNFMREILNSDNPSATFKSLENIYLKGDLPGYMKLFKCFQTIYPNFEKEYCFDFSPNSRISPELLEAGNAEHRFLIVYNDLLRTAVHSQDRTLIEYLNNISEGSELYFALNSGEKTIESISNEEVDKLTTFAGHLEALYKSISFPYQEELTEKAYKKDELTQKFKILERISAKDYFKDINGLVPLAEVEKYKRAMLKTKISLLLKKFNASTISTPDELKDKIVSYIGHSAGYDSFNQMVQDINRIRNNADKRNRECAEEYRDKPFMFEEGDFVRGIGYIEALTGSLNKGNVAKEFMCSYAGTSGSDTTPLDVDITYIVPKSGITTSIDGTPTGWGFGNIFVVIKKDNPNFNITRDKDGNVLDTKYDPNKVEMFGTYTPKGGWFTHWGARTGISFTDVDFVLYKENKTIKRDEHNLPMVDEKGNIVYVKNSNDRSDGGYVPIEHDALAEIQFEIARNGYYIPVIDMLGRLVFTPEQYDALRSKVAGLPYYSSEEYTISSKLDFPGINELVEIKKVDMQKTAEKEKIVRGKVEEIIKNSKLDVDTIAIADTLSKDLTEGIVQLIGTGSTSRGTNVPDDSDFDYMLKVDKKVYMHTTDTLIANFKTMEHEEDNSHDKRVRLAGVTVEELEEPFDIDISIDQKKNNIQYSTEMALEERLKTIRKQSPDDYYKVIANIVYAKQFLKEIGVYKSARVNPELGGLGGVGVENWILQNGGSFRQACDTFLEKAFDPKTGEIVPFNDFKKVYTVWDFGENHESKGKHPFDEYVSLNMNEAGYTKLCVELPKKLKEINEGLSKNRTIESTTPIIEEEIIEEEPLEASVGFGR